MKKSMGIVFIVVGVILAVVGIVMVSGGNRGAGDSVGETVVSVVEMKAKQQAVTSQSHISNRSDNSSKDEIWPKYHARALNFFRSY